MSFIFFVDWHDRDDVPLCDRNSVIPKTIQSTRMDYKQCNCSTKKCSRFMQLHAMLLIVTLVTNMTTLGKTQTPFNIITSPILHIFLSHRRLMVTYWPTKIKTPSLLITKL